MALTLSPQEILLRLFVATFMGAVLGVDRDLAGKPAGMRTLGLVALGAATITVATLFLPAVQADSGAMGRVLQGIIQGVLTGIGFIGAGAVLRRHVHDDLPGETKGLTTAASVFVVAALGVASGVGAWVVIPLAGGMSLLLLALLSPLEKRIEARRKRRAADQAESDSDDG